MQKIYTNIHMLQFFQPMILNSKVLHKKGASFCAGKHSCTSSKKNVSKAFFDITFYFIILEEVFKTIWTRVHTCQNGHASPL